VLSVPIDIRKLAQEEVQRFEEREKRDLLRMEQVVSFLTADSCQQKLLMRRFGDEPSPDFRCSGGCNFCRSGKAVPRPELRAKAPDAKLWQDLELAVQKRTLPSDDARLLARFALGEKSPRITSLSLSRNELFGAFEGRDFEEVYARCKQLCSE
ncbi:unnamed protein product, partial [Polarella glacialis]